MRKYKLTDETKTVNDTILYRIEALRDFNNVKAWDKGGFVRSEENLSHDGTCWIYDDAMATDCTLVMDDATMHDYASLRGHSAMWEHSEMYNHATMYGLASLQNNEVLRGQEVRSI